MNHWLLTNHWLLCYCYQKPDINYMNVASPKKILNLLKSDNSDRVVSQKLSGIYFLKI